MCFARGASCRLPYVTTYVLEMDASFIVHCVGVEDLYVQGRGPSFGCGAYGVRFAWVVKYYVSDSSGTFLRFPLIGDLGHLNPGLLYRLCWKPPLNHQTTGLHSTN